MKISIEMDTSVPGDALQLLNMARGLNGQFNDASPAITGLSAYSPPKSSMADFKLNEANIASYFNQNASEPKMSVAELPADYGRGEWVQAELEDAIADSVAAEKEPDETSAETSAIVEQDIVLTAESEVVEQPEVQQSAVASPPKRVGRRTKEEKAAADLAAKAQREANRQAEAQMLAEAVAKIGKPAHGPVTTAQPVGLPSVALSLPVAAATPPLPVAVAAPPALPLPGVLPLPAAPAASPTTLAPLPTAGLPPVAAVAPQTPAMPGNPEALPVIPPDGHEMSASDMKTVIRLASRASMGAAFAVMQKRGIFNPDQIKPEDRAAFCREVAISANMIAA